MIHPKDSKSENPRMQCTVCGKWKRLHNENPKPPYNTTQEFHGGCPYSTGGHLAGDHLYVCNNCCENVCKKLAKGVKKK